MKKLIAMLLAVVMIVGLAACGTINETEVAVLWSGDGVVHVPNSLINAVERAMYIENISYTHYGANGDQAEQTKQAKAALEAGCAALVVELVDSAAAQEIVDAAKAENVPVVFVNTDVDATVLGSYDKSAAVVSDVDSVGTVLGELVASSMKKKDEVDISKYDRNEDGKVSYVAVGDVSAVVEAMADLPLEAIADVTDAAGIASLTPQDGATEKDMGQLLTAGGESVELIITADDASAQEVLKALQDKGFNSNKLKTHCIPVYTIGNEVDAKSFENPDNYEPEEWEALIYTTTDLIGGGYIAGAAVTDYDSTAIALAKVLANMIKGADAFDGIDEENIDGNFVNIPYTTN